MRPGQQNKRGRGRGSNNGGGNFNRNKGGNPLSRTYDSSGPDVKIRGTAQHIAEKYSALARDAQSAGDRVMAENYLQHAEHYNRIIAAAQAQMQDRFHRDDRVDQDRDGNMLDQDDLEAADTDELGFAQQPAVDEVPAQQQQQPRREQRDQAQDQQPRENRRDRDQRRDRRQDRQDRQERREQQPAVAEQQPTVVDGSGPQPVIEGTPAEVVVEQAEQVEAAAPAERAPRRRAASRPRRPRRGEAAAEEGEASGEAEQPVLAEAASE